ncbi:MAG: beta-ketoacyl-ACP synthase II [Caedimonas sp.]|nr:beta-ketoacyl-ACP synthase II [Caedimonas sp.]
MRRVVVTGLGLVTPLGGNTQTTWNNLIAGRSGIRRIDRFDVSDLPTKIAGLVPSGDSSEGNYNPDDWLDPKEQRKIDHFIAYGVAAASQALQDSGWKAASEEDQCRAGVMIGSGIGGLQKIYEASIALEKGGPKRVSPFFIPSALINEISGHVSIKYGLKGPNHANVTACSTGAHAIGDAARLIQMGDADVMVAGGAESAVTRLGIAGFASMKALSTQYNDMPEKASRPWDKDRDGFVMGEGAGVVVLEEWEHARKRGACVYAEVIGYGLSGDAYHIAAPAPDGGGVLRCMKNALGRAGLNVDQVDYINAHATSTPAGDDLELRAIQRLMGTATANVSISSTKSSIGHLLGAAGGVEAIFAILSIHHKKIPPTLNLDDLSDHFKDMDLVPHKAKDKNVKVALSNSFGFGGTNASLVFRELA